MSDSYDVPADAEAILRDGCPLLHAGDVVVVAFGDMSEAFVIVPQQAGTMVAARFLMDGKLVSQVLLGPQHFNGGWAMIGRYSPPVKPARKWWSFIAE